MRNIKLNITNQKGATSELAIAWVFESFELAN